MTETVIGTSLDHYQEGLVKVASAIACRMPLVWVITNEERRFCEDLYDLCNSVKSQVHPDNLWVAAQLYTWDGLTGMLPMDSKKQNFFTGNMPEAVIAKYQDTAKAANAMKKLREEKVQDGKTAIALCMLDIHLGMTGEHIRMLKNWVYNRSLGKPENDRKYPTIVLVTSEFGVGPTAHKMPAALQTDIPVVFMDLPNRKIIDTIIDVQLEEWKKSLGKHKLVAQEYSAEEKTNLAYALAGLTTVEMNRIIKEIHTRNPKSKLDPALIVEEKKLILQRDGILEPIKPNVTMDDVAGLDLVKKYFQAYKSSFSEDAQKFGVVPPRGVLFVGVPGAGKSLFAKALASFYKMPLLRMDIGRLFNSLVGSSEARTREALKQAEAFGTALLWVDEIEKGLSGTQSSGQTDGGTTSRVFGTILTWMQEHKSNIIVIATANDVGALPPELLRRFNEIFFVDLPTEEEREEVFKVLLGHKNRKLAKFDKAKLVANSDKFTGAEIEKSIVEALAQAYADKQEGKCKDMTTEHIVEALNATRPIAVVQPERIQKIRDWAKVRARFASSKAWELASGKKAKGTEGAKSGEVDIDSMGDDLLV